MEDRRRQSESVLMHPAQQSCKKTLKTKFIFRKTNQLSSTDREKWLELFLRVFGKKKSQQQFNKKYLCTPYGYAYHGLMVVDGQIVGAYNAVPNLYRYFDKEVIFALSVDTMVDSRYRGGPFNVRKMAHLVFEAMKHDGICFVFGFPNDNAYDYTKRILKLKDIGTLNRYVLIRNIGAAFPKMRFLNPLSRMWGRISVACIRRKHISYVKYNIEKVGGRDFEQHRYDDKYRIIDLDNGGKCFYHFNTQNQSPRNVYITDVYPLTPYFFEEAVKQVYYANTKNLDAVVYFGRLPFKPAGMSIISNLAKLRKIRMCGMILDPDAIDDRVFLIKNWNVNASNYD